MRWRLTPWHKFVKLLANWIGVLVDFHGRVSAPMAKVLIKEREPYRPLFIEEPVLAEQAEYYPKTG